MNQKLISYNEKNTFFNLYQILSFVVQLITLSLLFYFITPVFNGFNDKLEFVSVPDRGLWLLMDAGIKYSLNELSQGQV